MVVFVHENEIYKVSLSPLVGEVATMYSSLRSRFVKSSFHKFKFLKKTHLNFESLAFNTARSAGTAALCEAKAALR